MNVQTGSFRRWHSAWLAVGVGLVAAAAGCQPAEPEVATPIAPNIAMINANPGAHMGRPVTLEGRIVAMYAPGVLAIGEGRPFVAPARDSILVMLDPQVTIPPGLDRGDRVRVMGTVRVFGADVAHAMGPDYAGLGQQVPATFYDDWQDLPMVHGTMIEDLRLTLPR